MHRDVKPANLFLVKNATPWHVKVVDFGVASLTPGAPVDLTQSLTRTGSIVGSPTYMSPEQIRGIAKLDARSDVWSLCVSLYRLVCGRTPRVVESGALGDLLITICCEKSPPLSSFAPWVEPALAAVIECGLALKPEDRFASAAALEEALDELLDAASVDIEDSDLRPLDETERMRVPAFPTPFVGEESATELMVPAAPPPARSWTQAWHRPHKLAFIVTGTVVGTVLGVGVSVVGHAPAPVVPSPESTSVSVARTTLSTLGREPQPEAPPASTATAPTAKASGSTNPPSASTRVLTSTSASGTAHAPSGATTPVASPTAPPKPRISEWE